MKVGQQFEATAAGRVELTFTCGACRYTSPVTVRAEGTGQATAWLFIGQKSAGERASARAQEAVGDHARALVELATCPACQKRDATAVRGNVARAVVTCLAYMGLGGWAAWMFSDELFMLIVSPIAGVVGGVQSLVRRLSLPGQARERVSFVRPPENKATVQSPNSLWRGPD